MIPFSVLQTSEHAQENILKNRNNELRQWEQERQAPSHIDTLDQYLHRMRQYKENNKKALQKAKVNDVRRKQLAKKRFARHKKQMEKDRESTQKTIDKLKDELKTMTRRHGMLKKTIVLIDEKNEAKIQSLTNNLRHYTSKLKSGWIPQILYIDPDLEKTQRENELSTKNLEKILRKAPEAYKDANFKHFVQKYGASEPRTREFGRDQRALAEYIKIKYIKK